MILYHYHTYLHWLCQIQRKEASYNDSSIALLRCHWCNFQGDLLLHFWIQFYVKSSMSVFSRQIRMEILGLQALHYFWLCCNWIYSLNIINKSDCLKHDLVIIIWKQARLQSCSRRITLPAGYNYEHIANSQYLLQAKWQLGLGMVRSQEKSALSSLLNYVLKKAESFVAPACFCSFTAASLQAFTHDRVYISVVTRLLAVLIYPPLILCFNYGPSDNSSFCQEL